jgi:hypothetical protein
MKKLKNIFLFATLCLSLIYFTGCDFSSRGGGGEEKQSGTTTSIGNVTGVNEFFKEIKLNTGWTLVFESRIVGRKQSEENCNEFYDITSFSSVFVGDTIEYTADFDAETTDFINRRIYPIYIEIFIEDCINPKIPLPCGCPENTENHNHI